MLILLVYIHITIFDKICQFKKYNNYISKMLQKHIGLTYVINYVKLIKSIINKFHIIKKWRIN